MLNSRVGWASVLAALSVMLFTGCGGGVAFTPAHRASIQTASVVHRSEYPPKERVVVDTFAKRSAAAWGGMAGVLISAAAAGDDRGALLAGLRATGTDPGLLIADAFEQELRSSGVVPVVTQGGAARFEFSKIRVGMGVRGAYTTALCPGLATEGKLLRKDGKVLWQEPLAYQAVEFRHTADEYAQQPQLLRAGYQAAARGLAKQALVVLQAQVKGESARRAIMDAEDAADDAADAAERAAKAEAKRQRAAQKAAGR